MQKKTRGLVAFVPAIAMTLLSACGGGGDGTDTTPTAAGPATNVSGKEFAFDPSTITASADEAFTVEFSNTGTIEHDFTIEGEEDDKIVAGPGDKALGTFTLGAGTHKFFCSVPGHEAAGMKGTLTVD